MKYLFITIFIVVILWPVLGLITQDMDFGGMGLLIFGIIWGFMLRKISEPKFEE
ncbi:hypothetical protein [Planococcus shixiaomingii]|uniref:hypothetical protein n=1 Tax=Planococcus shixiaomingii TaxID=3058393 RepID=UPI00261286AE|nr:hypothetical protein [Planococcus sp. N022]WKA53209.1 hypothetical protein QWY21_11115 [Planococcus sp. N022]